MNTETAALLLIDKASGWTSHDAAAYTRGVLGIKKIGHSGTLDPMATGLIILLLAKATKQQDSFQKFPKTYSGTLKLGEETDTWDAEGEVVNTLPVPQITQADILKSVQELTGDITHPVPYYSAKKINGEAMYKKARKGEHIKKESSVTIYGWSGISLKKEQDGVFIDFTVECSSGTYIRSLALLLGQKLGTTAHLTKLRRLQIGGYDVKDALPIEKLKQMSKEEVLLCVKPL